MSGSSIQRLKLTVRWLPANVFSNQNIFIGTLDIEGLKLVTYIPSATRLIGFPDDHVIYKLTRVEFPVETGRQVKTIIAIWIFKCIIQKCNWIR